MTENKLKHAKEHRVIDWFNIFMDMMELKYYLQRKYSDDENIVRFLDQLEIASDLCASVKDLRTCAETVYRVIENL